MKIDKIVFILLLSCLSFSCGRKETKERMKTYADAEKEFVGSLTKTDSITVLEMSQKCMDSLKEGNIEAALGMLYVVKDGEAVRLTNENAENLKKHFSTFPVVDYPREKTNSQGIYQRFASTISNSAHQVALMPERRQRNRR